MRKKIRKLDNLKVHIDKNRDDFELYPFSSEDEWKAIAEKVSPSKRWSAWQFIGVAACLILVSMGVVYQVNTPVVGELSEVENYYESEINHKISLVKSQIDDPEILDDLEARDHAFAELKLDLKDNVDNEEVIVAMMENYQLKLQILEEILRELDKEKSESSL